MATEVNSQPPIAWRYCGSQIKMWRAEAGISRDALAKEAGYDYEYIKSMENGRRRPTLRLLQIADQACGAGGKLVAAQEYLKPEPFPARSQEFMAIEAEAISFACYEPLLIPGLLQTEAYARALIGDSSPPLDDETVNERVAARLRRADALRRKVGVMYGFVIYEAALRTQVGGPQVMREQLQHLLEVGKLRNVSIQVLPFGRCSGVALNGSIVLLETPEHDNYGYIEAPEVSVLHASPDKVSALAQSHAMIRMHCHSVEESATFIREVAEER
ncbi:helix-turn-helix transcriptional regulator [Streptomyces sp. RY43-2]|uniref:Helix-turn-helix transcriptional regulator n=1 Tax=Streptomyces macrolidinus TaxID=2952607 RepID=A0ABT0ZD55_9ACTN|nr:helix-turn-helix transcriptional regulator [Streptomyces macrolidinus]MCN9241492.1 helix-turn-helix transcriptional regulator [Streptomyces macrolidinus]